MKKLSIMAVIAAAALAVFLLSTCNLQSSFTDLILAKIEADLGIGASCTVTFDKNDAEAEGTMEPQSIPCGESANLTACAFTKTGWAFAGWAVTADGEAEYLDEASYTMGTESVTLYATWTTDFTVTFNSNGGSAGAPQTVIAGGLVTEPDTPVKDWHAFVGWFSDEALTTLWNFSSDTVTQDITLYAEWNLFEKWITSGEDEADAYFGSAVSICGDYAIIGANQASVGGVSASGAAYIFHRTGANTWVKEALLNEATAEMGDFLGASVSIDGDYAVAGGGSMDGIGNNTGAAYVYHRTGDGTWDSGYKIYAADGAWGDAFGISVAISGDYIIAGAYQDDTDRGAAYIFHRTGTNTWDTGTRITAPTRHEDDYFGTAVSISGDYAVVGASGEYHGTAYVFHRTGTNSWSAGTLIEPPEPNTYNFGAAVSIYGDDILVGASIVQKVFVFGRTGTNSWEHTSTIFKDNNPRYFGVSVSFRGDYAVIGAFYDEENGVNSGAAFIYQRTGSDSWVEVQKLIASNGAAEDEFGESVAIYGDYAITGSCSNGENNEGSAYIYYRNAP